MQSQYRAVVLNDHRRRVLMKMYNIYTVMQRRIFNQTNRINLILTTHRSQHDH